MPLKSWRGREISAKAVMASKLAVDQTMTAAVQHAKDNHPFQNQTGAAESSLRVADFAAIVGMLVVGRWGSVGLGYPIFLEFLMGEVMGDTGWVRKRAGGGPFLRPAADAQYPLLRARIRANFQGLP